MIMSDKAITYLAENRERLLKKLDEFLSIPSVSTDSNYKNDIKKAAEFLETYLQEIGFENIEQKDTGGHPLVYAEYNGAGADKPTVLFYGHYDVQPVDTIDEWESDPFKPEIRNARLYGTAVTEGEAELFRNFADVEWLIHPDVNVPSNVRACM